MCEMGKIALMLVVHAKGDLQVKCPAWSEPVCSHCDSLLPLPALPSTSWRLEMQESWPSQLLRLWVSCQGGAERLSSMRAVNGFYGFVEHPKQQLLIIGCCLDTVAIYTFC